MKRQPAAPAPMPESVAPSHLDYTRDRYSLANAAEYLHVSVKFLYGLCAAKRIDYTRQSDAKNAKFIFNQAALDRYAESRPHSAMRPATQLRLATRNEPRRWDVG